MEGRTRPKTDSTCLLLRHQTATMSHWKTWCLS